MNAMQRWRLKTERAAWRLDQPQILRVAMWLIPILFGLLSMQMRQDNNWDLRNYHFYNPFAWLNGKVGFDLAPAQMQSYFNPTIDVLYYALSRVVPAPLVGFVMGAIHGLNFLILLAIGRVLLQHSPHGPQVRLPLLLALAGMLGAGVIAQLGNTMGDNLTALFVLSAVLLVLRGWRDASRGASLGRVLLAGAVMGLGVGLKLTNGVYALALCLALLLIPATGFVRIRAALVFGVGVLGGIAVAAGHWFWKMWTLFGNPLYPQFNTFFHSPMAGPVGVGDQRWLPQGITEKLVWPFIFALHPQRISEIKLSMIVWPVLYTGFIVLAIMTLVRRRAAHAPVDVVERSRENALLVFFALSYLIWLNLFSIHRYLIPLELVAPLTVWLLARRLFPQAMAGKIAAVVILVVFACSLQTKNWGRVGWARQPFSAVVPAFANPRDSMVFTIHADPPMGWIATFYPRDVAFVSLVAGFESPLFAQRINAMMAERKGPLYLMISDSGASTDASMSGTRKQEGIEADAAVVREASRILAERKLQFAVASCISYPAYMGDYLTHYRLCPVSSLVP